MVRMVFSQPARPWRCWARRSREWQVPQRSNTSWPAAACCGLAAAGAAALALAARGAIFARPGSEKNTTKAKATAAAKSSNGGFTTFL